MRWNDILVEKDTRVQPIVNKIHTKTDKNAYKTMI